MIETVGAVLASEGRVLLGLRAPHKSFPGCWDIIGGHVEAGESLWTALCRELAEELGVDAPTGAPLETIEWIDAAGCAVRLHVYSLSRWQGEPFIRNAEHTELRWFGFAEAQRLSNLALPHYRRLFASL